MSCHVVSRHAMPRHVTSRHVMSCHIADHLRFYIHHHYIFLIDAECKNYYTPDEKNDPDPDSYQHHYYWPPIPDGVTYFTFKVRAKCEVTLALSSAAYDTPQDMYQIGKLFSVR